MSISSELLTLQNTKTAIRTAINNKGGSVEASAPFASYATAIDNLPSGGSGNPVLTSIDVSDFTGTTFNVAKSYITDVTIPSGVTTIGNTALQYLPITSLTIPDSVTSIGNASIANCYSLASLTIGTGLRTVNYTAFEHCDNLTSVYYRGSLADWCGINFGTYSYGYSTLGQPLYNNANSRLYINNTAITGELTIPNTVTTLANGCFSGYKAITSVIIPDNVTTINGQVFGDCTNITTINIGSGITSIGSKAFYHCTGLTSFIINASTPPTLTNADAFDQTNNCPIYVPAESVDTYKAASRWSTYASRIFAIGDAITFTPTNGDPAISVKNYELTSANYVQSTDVPSTIKNGAGSLEICEGVTRIGTFAFQNGSSLTSVTLPSTLTRIDEAALMGCSSLTGITVNATTPPTLAGAAFSNTNNCPIYVPAASVDTYKAASGWSTYASRIVAIPSPTPSVTSIAFVGYGGDSTPTFWGEFEGCDETVNVDAIPAASSSSTFDYDIKAANYVDVLDNNGNDITSQCTFTSSDFYRWDSTQDPEYDGESAASYEWRLDTYIDHTDNAEPDSATITATYGNLSDTGTIEWTRTSNCQEPEPDPEEPEE